MPCQRSGSAHGRTGCHRPDLARTLRRLAAAAVVLAAVLAPVEAGARSQPAGDSEIGVTSKTIRIAVIADVDNPASPGAFSGSVEGVRAFAKFVNAHGGVAGRTVEVDFIDSHLSADEAHNALIKACQDDFAVVGTSAVFLNNVDPMVGCVDKAGRATGLPDIPVLQTDVGHVCSPVSFPVIVRAALDCATKDEHPQTYHTVQGATRYLFEHHQGLHGIWLVPSDLKAGVNAALPQFAGARKVGIKEDGQFGVHGLATQSDYTPFVQTIKQNHSTYALSASDYKSTVFLRREAKAQGVTSVKVWQCLLQCYDQQFLREGGADVESEYTVIPFVPLEEANHNRSIAEYLRAVGGKAKASAFGAQAWADGLFFRDVAARVAAAKGNDGLTRAAFLEEAAKVHDFTADGMLGPTDVGGHKNNGCFVLTQVKNGKFVRVWPKEKGTIDCNKNNLIDVQLDLT
jgi:ABC-type branched-subunit amino acid transport system substrate-binding protein